MKQRLDGYLSEKYVHIQGCQKIWAIPIPKIRPYTTFAVFVAFTHGVVGWSAVCDCGISGSYSLTFYFLSSYSYIFLIKIQQKSGIGVIREGGGYYAIPRT